ncbi:MAG: hypothetical protein V9E81_09430 [Marmoricola sp.]
MTKMLAPLGSRAVAALITALAAVLSQAAASAAATVHARQSWRSLT